MNKQSYGFIKKSYKHLTALLLTLFLCVSNLYYANSAITIHNIASARWKESPYTLNGKDYQTVRLSKFVNVFTSAKNSIVNISSEIEGLRAVKLPLTNGFIKAGSVKLNLDQDCYMLLGIFRDSAAVIKTSSLSAIDFNGGRLISKPVLKNALTITGLPAVDVYAIRYKKGIYELKWTKGLFLILGAIGSSNNIEAHDAGLPDGRLWEPFTIEGFNTSKGLFEIIGGPDTPVVDAGMAGTEGIQGGFEGGACVKIGNTYHMFPTERAGEKDSLPYYDRVKTRIGHWISKDAIHWERKATIYQASGTYSLTHDDNPLNDRRAAIWSYMPVFSDSLNRWYGYYLTYTVDKEISPNHSFGRIWRTESETPGMAGIGGPYKEGDVIMEPGLDTQPWEGRQGIDSFYPYQVDNKWLALYGGAYPYKSMKDYPDNPGKGWFVGLAKSKTPEGPWTRLDTTINPIKTIHPWFIENPIVYKLAPDCYITVFDGGPEGWGHHLPNMMAYSLSRDGLIWTEAVYLPIETKIKKWWDIMRTPMCLIDEGNDTFTIVYAAIDLKKRFHPLGKVQLKLNREVLSVKIEALKASYENQ